MKSTTTTTAALIMLSGLLVAIWASVPAMAVTLKETYKDWTVYTADSPKKICFAISRPKDSEPASAKRGNIFFYVSNWPTDKVSNEISVALGYQLDKNYAPTVSIGASQFTLFADGGKAFIADRTQEKKLVRAMKKGSTMVVKARSKRGTITIDKYSLAGISAAIKRAGEECK